VHTSLNRVNRPDNVEGVILLVATDLDGTFSGPEMVVPDGHAQAIDELGRRGVRVLVATSRRLRVVRSCFQETRLALPAVLLDRAIGIGLRTGDRFHQAVFAQADAVAALAAFRRFDLDPCVYVEEPDVDVVVSETPSTCAAHMAGSLHQSHGGSVRLLTIVGTS
jgi:hydroxymethylpyrimidine pyrophosphatase-like HAD family hydrolase